MFSQFGRVFKTKAGNNQPIYEQRTVMIVDDSPIDRLIIRKLVEREDPLSSVISCEAVAEAIAYLNRNAGAGGKLPSIIFLDLNLPGEDGFDFLRLYRQLSPHVHDECRIFMLSSSTHPDDVVRAEAEPLVEFFLTKPMSAGKLKMIIEYIKMSQPALAL